MRSRFRRVQPVGVALAALAVGALAGPRASARAYFPSDDEGEPPVEAPQPSVAPSSFGGVVGLAAVQRDARASDARVRAAAVARAAEMAREAGRAKDRRIAALKAAAKADWEKAAADDPALAGARALEDRAWPIVEDAALDGATDDLDGALRVRLVAARALADDPRKVGRMKLRDLVGSPAPTPRSIYVPPPPVAPWMPPPPPVVPPPPRTTRIDAALAALVQDTAAIALARLGDQDWLYQQALDKPSLRRSALVALAIAPSSALPPIKNKPLTRQIELLASAHDLRAVDALLAVAQENEPNSAALAMRTLAEMGDGRAATIARAVLDREHVDAPKLVVAAVETLAILRASGADGAVLALADDKRADLAREGARIAEQHPTAALVPVLARSAKAGDPRAIAALGRVGAAGVPALAELARDDANADVADAAAYALASCPAGEAEDALASLVESAAGASGDRSAAMAARKRRAVRAGAVRAARLGGAPRAVRKEAESLRASTRDADRWVSALLASVLDAGDARDLLGAKDVVLRRAAAVGLGAHASKKAAAIAREHLAAATNEDAEVVRALAAIAAREVDGSAEHDVAVSTSTLAVWLSEEGDAAALAAFLLAARGGDEARPFVARALASDDLDVRAAALLGLAVSPERTPIGELLARYPELADDRLRRAAVRALVARGDLAGKGALALARAFDPDAQVRAMAAAPILVEKAVPTTPLARGSEALQTKLVVPAGATARVTLTSSDGFTTPALADPEGFVLVFRVPAGEADLVARPVAAAPVATPAKAPAKAIATATPPAASSSAAPAASTGVKP